MGPVPKRAKAFLLIGIGLLSSAQGAVKPLPADMHALALNGSGYIYREKFGEAEKTFQEISKYGLHNIGDAIIAMAEAEDLYAHGQAVTIRLKTNGEKG